MFGVFMNSLSVRRVEGSERAPRLRLYVTSVLLAWATIPALAQHSGDVLVGHTAEGQLKIGGFIPDENIVVLPAVSGLFHGWAFNSPGFDRVLDADPEHDLYPMDTGAAIRLVVVDLDPALRAITSSFAILDEPGESTSLGGANLHTHLTWHINSDDPGFDPGEVIWDGIFKLVDTGSTGYSESAPFTFHFSNSACIPGDVNGDGRIDGEDIEAFMNVLAAPDLATPEEICSADVNQDGVVTTADIPPQVALLVGG